jgi:DNA-binding NarL/FixJ family response regulator
MSLIRVLVVEDFAPFRELIGSIIAQKTNLRVVCEVCDGVEAIQKAEELKPDLILLDIGLPRLSGIEAARQIRGLSASSKIIFVSQESDPEVVQEVLCLGAHGYVGKTRAGNDLLPAIAEVLDGRQFVSAGLIANTPTLPARRA